MDGWFLYLISHRKIEIFVGDFLKPDACLYLVVKALKVSSELRRANLMLFTRLNNADQALENLHFFENSYQVEEPCISKLERNVSRLAAVSGRVEDAQRDIEVVMVCLLSYDDNSSAMESLKIRPCLQ